MALIFPEVALNVALVFARNYCFFLYGTSRIIFFKMKRYKLPKKVGTTVALILVARHFRQIISMIEISFLCFLISILSQNFFVNRA